MRTEKELWEQVLSRTDLFVTGLCRWVDSLRLLGVISSEEESILDLSLVCNLPDYKVSRYSYPPGEIKPRIEWIKNRIKQLENEGKN